MIVPNGMWRNRMPLEMASASRSDAPTGDNEASKESTANQLFDVGMLQSLL
jgi:hypothetical protein